jgi:hypothetical protein
VSGDAARELADHWQICQDEGCPVIRHYAARLVRAADLEIDREEGTTMRRARESRAAW